jgi:hypothetical protein
MWFSLGLARLGGGDDWVTQNNTGAAPVCFSVKFGILPYFYKINYNNNPVWLGMVCLLRPNAQS